MVAPPFALLDGDEGAMKVIAQYRLTQGICGKCLDRLEQSARQAAHAARGQLRIAQFLHVEVDRKRCYVALVAERVLSPIITVSRTRIEDFRCQHLPVSIGSWDSRHPVR
jgi:hypothetical protein